MREERRDERAQVGEAQQENGRPPQQRLKNSGSRLDAPPEQHSHGHEDRPQQSQPEITGSQKKEKRREIPERQDYTQSCCCEGQVWKSLMDYTIFGASFDNEFSIFGRKTNASIVIN